MRVDVRVIAATNQNLATAIRSGAFREDLFYRLNVIPIEVPPLRERKEDIPLLVQHFLERLNAEQARKIEGITEEALERLADHDWPGNVRELENLVERMVVMRGEGTLDVSDLPAPFRQVSASARSGARRHRRRGHRFQRRGRPHRDQADPRGARETGGNKNQAARLLGLNRTTLIEKIKKKGLEPRVAAREGAGPVLREVR